VESWLSLSSQNANPAATRIARCAFLFVNCSCCRSLPRSTCTLTCTLCHVHSRCVPVFRGPLVSISIKKINEINARYGVDFGFQDRCLKPLGHPSIRVFSRTYRHERAVHNGWLHVYLHAFHTVSQATFDLSGLPLRFVDLGRVAPNVRPRAIVFRDRILMAN